MEKLLDKLPEWMRELPLLSVGFAVVWLLAGFFMQGPYAHLLNESHDAHIEATQLAERDGLIEVDMEQMKVVTAVNPTYTNDSLLGFMRSETARAKEDSAQARFDDAAGRAASTLNRHPFRTLGLVPSDANPSSFVTHVLIHGGFLHLMVSVVLFLVLAPILERQWGPLLFAGSAALIVVGSGLVYALAHSTSHRPLVGSSALIAGLAAALIAKHWQDEIECLAWLAPIKKVDFTLSVPALAVVWLAYEGSLWVIGQGSLPRGADVAIGYSGHAAALVLGGLTAISVQKIRDAKEGTSKAAGIKQRRRPRFDLAKVTALTNSGSYDAAYALLEAEVRLSARDRNVVMAYWDLAIQLGDVKNAAPVLVKHIEEELRRGAVEVVAKLWKNLHDHAPDVMLDAPTLIRLAPSIEKLHGEYEVADALWHALHEKNTGLTPELAATVARMGVEVNIRLATTAAKRALRSKSLDEKTRAEMKLLHEALAPNRPEQEVQRRKTDTVPAPSAFFEEADRSGFGEAADLSEMLDDCFPDGATHEAQPIRITARGLTVKIDNRPEEMIEFTRMHAVSVVGVHGMAEKPIVLIDFVIDGSGGTQPLTLIRLRCDRFDPRILLPKAESSKVAMRTLIDGLQKKGLHILADITATGTDTRPVFDSVEAYHDKIIRPLSARFA